MQKDKSLAANVIGPVVSAEGIRDKLSLTWLMMDAPKLATLLVDWILNSDISVLLSDDTFSSNQTSDVGEPLNKAWFVVALLSTGIIDLADIGLIRSKITTY